MGTEEKFDAAVNIIRSLPKNGPYQPSKDMMLKFYGLYKQAVEGPCTEPKPAFYEVIKGYKWQAWSSLGEMTKTQAMETYVDELKKIIETMAYTENVANFIDALGPFYEFVDIPGKKEKLNNNTNGIPDGNLAEGEEGQPPPVVNGVNHNGAAENGDCSHPQDSPLPPFPSQHSNTHALSLSKEFVLQAEELREATEYAEEEEEVIVVKVEDRGTNAATHEVLLSSHVCSDSDSDEEYSEPAETPDHLAGENCEGREPALPPHPSHHQLSLVPPKTPEAVGGEETIIEGVVSCGGGDQTHPGGLQMAPRFNPRGQGSIGQQSPLSTGSQTTPAHQGFSSGVGGSGGAAGGGGGGGGRPGAGSVREDVNAQLVMVLRRLQADMESVLHRLNTLETLTISHHGPLCHHCQQGASSSPSTDGRTERSWWPFPELSPRSTFFLLMWPFVVFGSFKLLPLIRCRRKRP